MRINGAVRNRRAGGAINVSESSNKYSSQQSMIHTSVLYVSNSSCSNRFSLYPAEHAARKKNKTLMKINLNLASSERVNGEAIESTVEKIFATCQRENNMKNSVGRTCFYCQCERRTKSRALLINISHLLLLFSFHSSAFEIFQRNISQKRKNSLSPPVHCVGALASLPFRSKLNKRS